MINDIERYDLTNGLSVGFCNSSSCDDVTIYLGLKMGSMFETKENNGASHFIEHMFLNSTGHMSMRKLGEILDWNAFGTDASTSREHVSLSISGTAKQTNLALDTIYKIVSNKKYQKSEFEKEKGAILSELIQESRELTTFATNQILYPYLFQNTPLELNILGTKKGIERMTAEGLMKFRNKFFSPENMFLTIAGDLSGYRISKIKKKIIDTFGDLPSQGKNYIIESKKIKIKKKKKRFVIERRDLKQAYLVQGFAVGGYNHEDYLKLKFLHHILGGCNENGSDGFSSRLYGSFVQKEGLGYIADIELKPFHCVGLFNLFAEFDHKKERKARQVIKDVYDRLQNDKISKKELNGVRRMILKTYPSDSTELAEDIFEEITYGRKFPAKTIESEIKNISRTDILETAQKYLSRPKVEVILRPKKLK